MSEKKKWQIWIDTGGTFTDCIAIDPLGKKMRTKVLSSSRLRGRLLEQRSPKSFRFSQNWRMPRQDIFSGYDLMLLGGENISNKVVSIDWEAEEIWLEAPLSISGPADFEITAHEEAPILAARLITGTPLDQSLPPLDMRLGSTKGTNALLERKGARVAFLITKGFADLVVIGTQQRPNLFQLDIPEPPVLYEQVFEVEERLNADGRILTPLTDNETERLVSRLRASGCEAVAIALLHAYRNPVHELKISKALQDANIRFVSLSHLLTPSIKIFPRAQTTLVNAYLAPIIHDYLSRIQAKTGDEASLRVMTSAGGLIAASNFHPKDSLLSGPAGGVVGAARVAGQLGFPRVLTLDMGGTSTDTARYDGTYDYQFTTHIDRIEMISPALSIETVAAGGGSICYFDGNKLSVGPESAGASPGPACYGAGGPLTITDVNLLLGKLDPAAMGIPVNPEQAAEALRQLQHDIEAETGTQYTGLELLRGFEKIADEKMAEAIRRISVAKGFDPKDYALLAFGGAGGLHACRIAELLDIDTILLPLDGGLLSAFGIGHARVERLAEQQILQPLTDFQGNLNQTLKELGQKAISALQQEGFPAEQTEIRDILIYLRFKGQDSPLEINYSREQPLADQFENRYRRLFGHYPENRPIEVESVKVIAATRAPATPPATEKADVSYPEPAKRIPAVSGQRSTAVYFWETLSVGARIEGPAILLNPFSTAFVAEGWQLETASGQNLILRQSKDQGREAESHKEAIELELFTNRFSAIAEEMGAQLQRTAFSVNIKERLDFSCALLDAEAELLVNAPHIPVHLGSLGICARLILEKLPLKPGDVIITNHPRYGGSHLPDVTLLSGIYTVHEELIGYAINRAHHAEIGGRRPGSMPPDATTLAEEGVAILPAYLVKGGEVQWSAVRELLKTAAFPTRALEENLADINAALASLRTGEQALQALVDIHGLEKVHYYMNALKKTARQALTEALLPLEGKSFKAEEKLDDGHAIKVHIGVENSLISLDFSGSSASHPHNLNANISIVYSAVIYVLRLLCGQEIPLNEGLMQTVDLQLPTSFLHPDFQDDPRKCPAVVGGNTEVSQRLVDTLLKAFKLAACSQGTMNNFLFGNDRFGYYETIGGGAGAGEGFHGRSGVHQHMTNTRITDPEELEFRYPVRLHRFGLRSGSGGMGRWKGGDGIIREVEFLEPMEMTILSQHRKEAPYGMNGGQPGKTGQQYIIRENGKKETLNGVDSAEVAPGDHIVIETPGGGGWGEEE